MATPDEELRQTILAYGADIQRQMREMFDLAALSDPTDSHSLEELRAHLEDGGDLEPTMDELDVRPVCMRCRKRSTFGDMEWMNTQDNHLFVCSACRFELSGRLARGAAAMAREQQQPMSDARLEDCRKNVEMAEAERNRVKDMWPMSQEWHEADAQIAYLLHTTMTARDLLAEVERLRAREAALLEVVRAVANGHLLCTCGMTFYPERPPSYSSATFIVSSDIRHRADCPIMKARALLASESADEAK